MATQSMKISSVLRIAGLHRLSGWGRVASRRDLGLFARSDALTHQDSAAAGLFCILAPLLMRTMRIGSISQTATYVDRPRGQPSRHLTTVYLFCVLSVMFADRRRS